MASPDPHAATLQHSVLGLDFGDRVVIAWWSKMSTPCLFVPVRSPRSSLMYPLPIRRLKDILGHIVPGMTLTTVEEIPSTRLPRLYYLNLSDGEQLLLSFAPTLAVRLLRHEQTLLSSEATLIHFLSCMLRSDLNEESALSSRSITGSQGSRVTDLSQLVPIMVKHSSNPREMGYPYTLFEPGEGEPLSELSIYLSRPEQRLIDKQIGTLVRDLALITSPSGNFGTVSRVCNDPSAPAATESSRNPRGSTDWNGAFMSLVEGILRDGEDMSVLLPYEVIRRNFDRLSWRLSAITIPRLFVIDAGEPSNVLIQRDPEGASPSSIDGPRVKGLRDWSQGIFGDPLLSSCFEDSSEGFLEGWRLDGTEDIIEDEEGRATRLLLYRCYRAIVNIVTEYYRPQADSSRRELEGRRKLTNVLAELEKVDVEQLDFVKRARSPSGSGGEGASKRQKQETAHT